MKKILIVSMLIIILIISFCSISRASSIANPMDNPDSHKPGNMSNATQVQNIGNQIIGVVQFIGSFVSVIVLVVMGIKYMTGSIEEKAEYKKTMIPYIVGAILVFAITNILGIVNSITDGIF